MKMQQNIAHDIDEKQRTKDVILEENVNFASLLLPNDVTKGLTESGFRRPSPIQFKALPLGRCGFDLILKSKSGTGKTLVFSTIALESVNLSKEHPQVLILVPTREIAVQIQDVLKNIGRYIEGLVVESFIGGLPVEEDIKKTKQCHIAVGAPGRIKHLINLGALSTQSIRLFVLDEADKLMGSSFQTDINEIFDTLPQRKQIIAASATYPRELDNFLANYMLSPTHVTSENETPLLLGLKQFVATLKATTINAVQQMRAKNEILLEIFSKVSFTQCLVFTNYQSRTESVCNYLNQKGWDTSFISAASHQSERLEAIKNLKDFKSRILLSTDLTSRGIDAPNVDLVINYDLPHDAVTYLHRMGRAGRYGSSGICISFASEGAEINKLQNILGTIGSTNLSISKLPPLNGNGDLWQLDPKNLEQIWGVMPSSNSNEINENIKKEVLTLKQRKNVKGKIKSKSDKKGKKKIKLDELSKVENVQDILNTKKEAENCLDSSTDMDTENLLNSLISGEDNTKEVKKRKRGSLNGSKIKLEELNKIECVQDILDNKDQELMNSVESSSFLDTEQLLSSLISDTRTEDDNMKYKRDDVSQKSQNMKEITFSKNKALLCVTKLVYDCNTSIDTDVMVSIEEYLQILKSRDSEDNQSKTVEEILEYSDNSTNVPFIKTEEIDLVENLVDTVENIFKIGYQSALKNDGKSWFNSLPLEEVQQFQEFCRAEQVILSESEDEDKEETGDYEMEEYEEVESVVEVNDQDNDISLPWVPIVQNENSNEVENVDTNSDHFVACYNDCSNALWQTGLTFETVPEFDDWFYQWQEQLQSVRNYVQQNIYIEEMSKYQRNRLTNK